MKQNKFMGYLQHDACSVACFVVGAFCTTVLHVFKHLQGGIHQFVTLAAMDVNNHTHATSVVLILRTVKSLV